MKNKKLNSARKHKADEFYTLYEDIDKELWYYQSSLEGKIVYCNCDNPDKSNFYKFFKDNFHEFKLKKLIATYYEPSIDTIDTFLEDDDIPHPTKTVYDGMNEVRTPLKGNGDFRSEECVEILKDCDVVITNPPFSLMRPFIVLLINNKKPFIILSTKLSINYADVFIHVKNNSLSFGFTRHSGCFEVPQNYYKAKLHDDGKYYLNVDSIKWLQSIVNPNDILINYIPTTPFSDLIHKKFDYLDIINVDKVKDIPMDYDGLMGVPITFLQKYNQNNFEIIDILDMDFLLDSLNLNSYLKENKLYATKINGHKKFMRLIIKRKK